MANPNNLIRPPVINQPPPPAPPIQPVLNQNDLVQLITRLVSETLHIQGRQIFNSIMNPAADINNDIDQPINIADNNLNDLDKIPDVVKSLREFSGQTHEFNSWKKSIDRILKIYEHLKGTPRYYGILSVIRNKITGHADVVLESYNTPLNWGKISKCLTLHYADKRDLGTLEYQMTTLVQGNNTVPEFYQAVYHHLSLILNKLGSIEMSQDSMNNMTQCYRDKALDTFVRGLKGDLPRLLSIREPADLPQALHLCLKLQNVDFRAQHANNSQSSSRKMHQQAPSVPPRRENFQNPTPIPAPRREFYPHLLHDPRTSQSPQFDRDVKYQPKYQQHQQPKIPPNQRPLPPKPMSIDYSLKTQKVNYQNRPRNQQFTQKRQHSQQMHPPQKMQRIYHTQPGDDEKSMEEYEAEIAKEDQEYDESLEEYVDQEENNNLEQPEELDDIYFLD